MCECKHKNNKNKLLLTPCIFPYCVSNNSEMGVRLRKVNSNLPFIQKENQNEEKKSHVAIYRKQ